MESTKTSLVNAIYLASNYTKKQIEEKYQQELNKIPGRQKYYAKKHAIKVLQWFLYSLRQQNGWKNIRAWK